MKSFVALAAALLMFVASPDSSAASSSTYPVHARAGDLLASDVRITHGAVLLAEGGQPGTREYFEALDSYASWMKSSKTAKRPSLPAKSTSCSTTHGAEPKQRSRG